MIDANLQQFATDKQWEYYKAVDQYGSHRKAANALNCGKSSVTSALKSLRKKASLRGYAPDHDMTNTAPEGYHVKGTSTLYRDGEVALQWVKTNADQQHKYEQLEEAALNFAEPFKAKSGRPNPPKNVSTDLINVIPFGDPHIGLYAWSAEVGEDFDCDIAEQVMVDAVDYLVKTAPKANTALIINLGDFYHSDVMEGVTTRSGHKLDVDSRWSRVLEIGIRIMRRCIDSSLKRHNKVVVMNTIGNHDDMTSQFLSIVMREYYRNNERVEIKDSKRAFQYHQFGKNLFGVTHGHTVRKPGDFESIMAADCEGIWSETHRRKWFVGHFHSQRVHDLRTCLVEYYRNTAPNDAWATAAGYRSYRDMRCETWHSEKGHLATNLFDPLLMC